MASIGREEYPELTLSQSVEITEKVGRQSVKTTASLAQVMGLKSIDSGYFYHQVSALTKYFGVLNRTKESVSLSPLGQRIAHPVNDADRRLAVAEAAGRVHLLQALYEALGQNFHEADFRAKLRDVTGATPPEIDKSATYVERLYRDAIPYIAQVPLGPQGVTTPVHLTYNPDGSGPALAKYHAERLTQRAPNGLDGDYRVHEGDGVHLAIKKDMEALEEALETVEGWIRLQKKLSTRKPDQTGAAGQTGGHQ